MTESQPSLAVRMEDGTTGVAVGYRDGTLQLDCPQAYPPGKPLTLVVQLPEREASLSGRCIGSKQTPEGDYRVRLRLTNLRRDVRQALQSTLG